MASADDDADALAAAVRTDASGPVVKLARSSNSLGAMRVLGAGGTLIGEALMDKASSILNARTGALDPRLDDQALEVLERVLGGQTDRRSPRTWASTCQ